MASNGDLPGAQYPFHSLQVLLRIHAHGVERRLRHMNLDPMIQEPQLLQTLGPLQFRFGPGAELLQSLPPVRIKTKMLEPLHRSGVVAIEGNSRASKVKRSTQ